MIAPKESRLPQIFHIGLPRTGTTTIQSVLRYDPRIVLTSKKFFQTSSYYSDKFPLIDHNEGVIVHSDETMLRQKGNYAKMLLTLWRIHTKVPKAKIILTIREQRSWLLSRYRYGVGTGHLRLTFEEWLFSRQGIDFLSLGHYGMVYQALLTYFPRENVYILPYELLRDNYNEYFRQLYEIIKLVPAIPEKIIHKNASLPDEQLACKRHLNRLVLFHNTAFARYSVLHKIQYRVIRKLSEVISKVSGVSVFSESKLTWPQTKAFNTLLCDFARSNQELNKLSGLPLDKYGYYMKS